MTHFEKVQADMYTAMKSGDKEKANTLRNVLSKLKDKQIAVSYTHLTLPTIYSV